MFIVFIRTAILYSLVVIVMRLMGKRQIGELQPYEFVITIMISDLAALPMQDTRLPLILGIIPILTLLFIKTILTSFYLIITLVPFGILSYIHLESSSFNLMHPWDAGVPSV